MKNGAFGSIRENKGGCEMTVRELIEKLEKLDKEANVLIFDGGEAYYVSYVEEEKGSEWHGDYVILK